MRAHTKPVGFACGISEKVRAPQRARARVSKSLHSGAAGAG